jgi:hypothetical protein
MVVDNAGSGDVMFEPYTLRLPLTLQDQILLIINKSFLFNLKRLDVRNTVPNRSVAFGSKVQIKHV